MDANERRRLTDECRSVIETRTREPGDDDVLEEDEEELGVVLAKIRLGVMKAPDLQPPTRHRRSWIDDVTLSTSLLLGVARQRFAAAPWAATEEDIAWGKSLREHLEELQSLSPRR